MPRGTRVLSQAVITNGFIFLLGPAGFSPETGKLINDSFEGQVTQTFANVKTILEAAGSSMDKIVKTSMFMVSGCNPDFSIVNKIYGAVLPDEARAQRTAVDALPGWGLVFG